MKLINISSNLQVIIDEGDDEIISKFTWYPMYAKNGQVYARTAYQDGNLLMHRFIMNAKEGEIIDHRNHNGLDNRKENLRLTNQSNNQANSRKSMNKSSKYKGVHYSKRDNKYIASIMQHHKTTYLGAFELEEQAAIAYDKAAKELFGEYAYLNFRD